MRIFKSARRSLVPPIAGALCSLLLAPTVLACEVEGPRVASILSAQRARAERFAPTLGEYLSVFLECERCIPDCSGWKEPPSVDCTTLDSLKIELGNQMQKALDELGAKSGYFVYGETIVLVERLFASDYELIDWRSKRAAFDMYRGPYQHIHQGQPMSEVSPPATIFRNDHLLTVGVPVAGSAGYVAAWYVTYSLDPEASSGS